MKKLIIALAIVLMAATALAQPYIASNPQTDASVYRMRLSLDNGATWGEWVEGPAVNSVMRYDIAPVAKGLYKGEAQAGAEVTLTDSQTGVVSTVKEWSVGAFFILHKKQGNAPSTLKLER